MATTMCDVCDVRQAVVTVRRVVPGEPARTESLCEVHAAEAGVSGSSFGGRSPFGGSFLGGGLFDEFFGRFFDDETLGGTRGGICGGRTAAPRRRAEQVDVTRFFSDATNELLGRPGGPWSGAAPT